MLKIKKIVVLTIVIGTLLLVGCDRIEGPYLITDQDETSYVEFPALDVSTVYRKVLIEEFTGHRCQNCPTGHQKLEELHERFGDTLVPVGIHYGSLAAPNAVEGYPYDFRTEIGTAIGQDFAIDGIPTAIINRGYAAGGYSPVRWQSKIEAVDRSTPLAAIQLINEYDAASSILTANAKVTMLVDCPNPLRLALYLVEDGIVKPQLNGTEYIADYVHNHVLRAGFNGIYGKLLNGDGILKVGTGYTYAKKLNFKDSDWNPANCSVVAVLYDRTAGEVLQVEVMKVM